MASVGLLIQEMKFMKDKLAKGTVMDGEGSTITKVNLLDGGRKAKGLATTTR